MRFLPALLAFLLCPVLLAPAQDRSDTLKIELDPIQINSIHLTISAENAPLSLGVVNRSLTEMNSEAALTLDKILNQLPGIWVNDRETYALGESIMIRGLGWRAAFGVRGIQVIMDDIPLTVADGQSMLTSVDPAFINNIELIRGPASTFWGNSSGGVLYLSTPSATGNKPVVRARSVIGSYGLFKQELHLSKSAGRHKVMGYTSYLSEDGYREHSAAKLSRSGVKGSVDINSQSRLEYMGAFVAMPQAQHPSSLTKQQVRNDPQQANPSFEETGAGKQVYQAQAGINYYRDTSAGFLTFTGYGIYRDLNNPLPFAIIDLERWAGGLRGTLERTFNNWSLNMGFDAKWQHDDRNEFENINGSRGDDVFVNQLEKVNNQALFATSALKLGKVNILGGLRFDRLTFDTDAQTSDASGKRTFHALSPGIGLAYSTHNIKVFTNLSTSFEAPTTTELVNRPDGGNGFNPDLKPERTIGLETGTRGSLLQNNLMFDIALYQLWIHDLLFPYQLETNGPTFYRNQGETSHYGIEGRLSARFFRHISSGLTYNYTRATFKKAQTLDGVPLKGKTVPGIPEHRLGISVSYYGPSFLADLTYQYVSSYPVNNLNTAGNDSYGFADAKISLINPFGGNKIRVQPFLNVNNIFDAKYNGSVVVNNFGDRYYEPAAGRNWQFGVSVEFY